MQAKVNLYNNTSERNERLLLCVYIHVWETQRYCSSSMLQVFCASCYAG